MCFKAKGSNDFCLLHHPSKELETNGKLKWVLMLVVWCYHNIGMVGSGGEDVLIRDVNVFQVPRVSHW